MEERKENGMLVIAIIVLVILSVILIYIDTL